LDLSLNKAVVVLIKLPQVAGQGSAVKGLLHLGWVQGIVLSQGLLHQSNFELLYLVFPRQSLDCEGLFPLPAVSLSLLCLKLLEPVERPPGVDH
jgi:hypothetical protein